MQRHSRLLRMQRGFRMDASAHLTILFVSLPISTWQPRVMDIVDGMRFDLLSSDGQAINGKSFIGWNESLMWHRVVFIGAAASKVVRKLRGTGARVWAL